MEGERKMSMSEKYSLPPVCTLTRDQNWNLACLPLKHLNLSPKEKTEDGSDNTRSSPSALTQSQVPDVETFWDNLENNFHMGSDIDFRPKLVNEKGLLDNFLRSRVKTTVGKTTAIDLMEDLSDQPNDIVANS